MDAPTIAMFASEVNECEEIGFLYSKSKIEVFGTLFDQLVVRHLVV